ncbi:H-NS histone family protein [Rubrivivax sp. A210]|uniref:H-NS histone family protein n=1 Tax=Rubrivivax sp. A210 TaxID=2772301 RepID=UPI001918CB43|nr:H-NS histone family protein [Rubrivivax sp. A210]CAD5374779.1 H-NS histone family protein [Rubrivivax sp. A210]
MATKKIIGQDFAAIQAQIAALEAQAQQVRKKEVAAIIAQAREAIAHYGITAADLGFGKAKAKAGTAASKPAAAKKTRKAAGKKAATKAKFKDDQGHSWSGRGKRPGWYTAALAAGKTPEDLLVKD